VAQGAVGQPLPLVIQQMNGNERKPMEGYVAALVCRLAATAPNATKAF
jgi:hypothetical protein